VTRPALSRIAACLATGLVLAVLGALAPVTAAAAAPEDASPLRVEVDSLTPSTIPLRGDVTVTGTVTNRSDQSWTNLKAYMLTSGSPLTTEEELAEAAKSDPAAEVGARITTQGLYDDLGDLDPGDTARFLISVPRRSLGVSGEPGVYWLGVHVLGADESGRDNVADGRARTFLPLMRASGPRTTVSLVVPVRAKVVREPDGTLRRPERWESLLGKDGRLGRLLALTGSSGDKPVSLLVDPAVLDAAESVTRENPARDTGPTDDRATSPSAGPDDQSGESSGGEAEDLPGDAASSPGAQSPGTAPETDEELSAAAQRAATWLDSLREQTAGARLHSVLGLPYGDVDVAAMLGNDFEALFEHAVDLSTTTLADQGLEAEQVVAPAKGVLPSRVVADLPSDTRLILSDRAAPEAETSVIETLDGHRAALVDTAASSGDPAPGRRYSALGVRQRILSEAAVRALTGPRGQPLVVSTPPHWNPGPSWRAAAFFGGLDVPWLRVADLTTSTAAVSVLSEDDIRYDVPLSYPRRQRRAELPAANVLATDELYTLGETFGSLLDRNDTVQDEIAAMLASSWEVRKRPRRAVVRARNTSAYIRADMRKVSISGPSFVTMSSEEGTFAVTVVNDLEEPVTVGIRAETAGAGLQIDTPDPVSLGPGQRASVRMNARSQRIGVYSVTLRPETLSGRPLGSSTKFSVRSSQVGLVIWIIIGIGGVVFVVAVGVRIYRRVTRRRSARPDEEPPTSDETADEARSTT
jgi:hypothetical protein